MVHDVKPIYLRSDLIFVLILWYLVKNNSLFHRSGIMYFISCSSHEFSSRTRVNQKTLPKNCEISLSGKWLQICKTILTKNEHLKANKKPHVTAVKKFYQTVGWFKMVWRCQKNTEILANLIIWWQLHI